MCRLLSTALFCASSSACALAGPSQLPSLSIRAIAVIHDHDRKHGTDYALTAQLSFFSEVRETAALIEQLNPEAQLFSEAASCGEPALCLWASAAEQSALLALGVLQ